MPGPYTVTFSTFAGNVSNPPGGGNWTLTGSVLPATTSAVEFSNFLQATGPSTLGSSFAANEVLTSIQINITRATLTPDAEGPVCDQHVYFVVASALDETIDFAAPLVSWPTSAPTLASYAVTGTQLGVLGIDKTKLTSSFGIAIAHQAFNGGASISRGEVTAISMVWSTSMVESDGSGGGTIYRPPFSVHTF